jgi:hypothetical protein
MAKRRDRKQLEHDPSAELGVKNPVRDQQRLGAEKYNVTPPRSEVRAPQEQEGVNTSCTACRAELDPVHSYRIDADAYAYHFCGEDCYQRWRQQADAGDNVAQSVQRDSR